MNRIWAGGCLEGLGRRLSSIAPSRSLKARAFLWYATGMLVAMAIFAILANRMAGETTQQVLNDRLFATGIAARNFDLVLGLLRDDLVDEASRLTFDPQDGVTEEAKSLMRWASQHMKAFSYHISLVDQHGTVRWVEPDRPSLVGTNLADRPFVSKVLASHQPQVSDMIPTSSGKRLIVVAAPVADRQGRFSGFLNGEMDLGTGAITKLIPPIEMGTTGYVQVVDSDGNVLMDSSPAGTGTANYDRMGHLRALVAGGKPRIGNCYNCHEGPDGPERQREIMAFYPLSTTSWGVVVRQSEAEAMAPIWQLQWELLGAGVVVLLMAPFAVYVGTRRVFNHLETLTDAATRISRGDFDASIPHTGKDEVGKLAQSFEHMRTNVRAFLQREQRWRQSLEEEVSNATKDMSSLYEVSQTVNKASLNLQELLSVVLGKVIAAIEPADAGVLFLYERGQWLVPAASIAYDLAELSGVMIKPGEGMTGKALQEGLIVCNSRESIRETRRTLSEENRLCIDRAAAPLPYVRSAMALPLVNAGQTHGAMVITSHSLDNAFAPPHINLARLVAEQVAVGLANARLYEEVQQREAIRSDLLKKLISAQEEERRRVARELHDEAGQALTAVMMSASRAEQVLPLEMQEAKSRLVEARARASQALDDVRRLILDLRPQVLDDLGLVPALRWFVKNRLPEASLQNRLEISGIRGRLPSQVEVTVFRVVQEALTNVVRHGDATKASVRLSLKDSILTGVIEDDGKGFDAERVLASQSHREGWGLTGMEERVCLVGGTLRICSQPGRGTRIRFEIPMESFQEGASNSG